MQLTTTSAAAGRSHSSPVRRTDFHPQASDCSGAVQYACCNLQREGKVVLSVDNLATVSGGKTPDC